MEREANEVSSQGGGRRRRWRWYHGVLFYAGVQVANYGLAKIARSVANRADGGTRAGGSAGGGAGDREFYNGLRRPVFAPPGWAFPPVWTINNALCIWGLLRVLNMPAGTPGRERFLRAQGGAWVVFASFNAIFFGLRSTVGGALLTLADLALTVETLRAAGETDDAGAALSQATILPWLVVAGATSIAVAAWNGDEFLSVGPACEPPAGWLEQASGETAGGVRAALLGN